MVDKNAPPPALRRVCVCVLCAVFCVLSCVACRVSRVACRVSRVACRVSRVACRVSRVACRVSRVACRVWCVAAEAWWRGSSCRVADIVAEMLGNIKRTTNLGQMHRGQTHKIMCDAEIWVQRAGCGDDCDVSLSVSLTVCWPSHSL